MKRFCILVCIFIKIILLQGLSAIAQQDDVVRVYYFNQEVDSARFSITYKNGFHVPEGSTYRGFISTATTLSLSDEKPYIIKYRPLAPLSNPEIPTLGRDKVQRDITYFDGNGQKLQEVKIQASPRGFDIVYPFDHDLMGRETTSYMPYEDIFERPEELYGNYEYWALTTYNLYYMDGYARNNITVNSHPYSQTRFEDSPLNRVREVGSVGKAWQITALPDTSNTQRLFYKGNEADEVVLYTVLIGAAGERTLTRTSNNSMYSPNSLDKTAVHDENWKSGDMDPGTVHEFKDRDGRVVLKRSFVKEGNNTITLSTYYVYDELGHLCFVLPPGAIPDSDGVPNQTALDNFCYQYRYDNRGRCVEKKIPGKGKEFIIYNELNQVVLTQDAVQRGKSPQEWYCYKYDGQGRTVMEGIYSHGGSTANTDMRSIVQSSVTNGTVLWESRVSGGEGYSNQSFPTTGLTHQVLRYYDDYDLPQGNPYPFAEGSKLTMGLETAKKVSVLGTSDYLWTVSYYDEESRLAKQFIQHYKDGQVHLDNVDEITNNYSFVGDLLSSGRIHRTAGGAPLTIVDEYEYDHRSRLSKKWNKIGNQQKILVKEQEYNILEQHTGTDMGVAAVSYSYNERGWLKKISSSHFTEELKYNDPSAGATPQFNGNISEQHWKHGSSANSTMKYSYDATNRLLSGISSTPGSLSEVLTYDVMGNIKTLLRDGGTMTSYSYTGNKLQGLSGGIMGAYDYDANGNATLDRTGMAFTYNHLNLPKTATKTGASVSYVYDAEGAKLRKFATVGSTSTQRDYIGGIEYSKVGSGTNAIEMIHTDEGYLQNNGGNYVYHYNLTDHLGNVRATLQRTSATAVTVIQKHDYYPFGKAKAIVTSGVNKYLYNGKEVQEELGGQLDYGARFYDAEIGRWNVVDPLAEQGRRWSPYTYAFNNPIRFIDPDGMWPNDGIKKFFRGFGTTLMGIANGSQLHNQIISSVSTAVSTVEHLSKGDYSGAGNQFLESTGAPEIVRTVGKAADGDMEAIGSVAAVVTVGIVTHKAGGKQNVGSKAVTADAVEDLVRVRHHSTNSGVKGIEKSNSINASRGEPYGVDVEVAPFLPPSKVNMGQVGGGVKGGGFVEFSVPKSAVGPIPGYMGGTGNAGRIVTGGSPLNLNGTKPTFNRNWWNW
ncbi:RHS repeat-associated core domain-containing protein [Sphingobacterium olei]|uniref:RHS repeat-associated core domain-containing protein n=1 Tax=Sphingobacterium olei TaxID=2571155 RepID=A0A4V5MKK2_9SPHI|nr:DUF6443 domain-containing protein [Sphingobacterium olei]TJZ53578.1 RHS repeat-associated core domain-containing protein [Sphingobacterium olei]